MKPLIFPHAFHGARHLFAAAALMALAAAPALAQTSSQTPMVVANVVSVTPAMQPVPVQVCGPGGPNSGVGAAVGAVTGGLIGSQFGRGNGHTAGAVVGAIGGAFVGDAAESQQRANSNCVVQYQNRMVGGYDVVYELDGHHYQIRTAVPPSQTIRVPAPGYGVAPLPLPSYAYPRPPSGDSDATMVPPPPPYYPYPPAVADPGVVYPAYPAYPAYYPAPAVVGPPVGVTLSIGGGYSSHGRGNHGRR